MGNVAAATCHHRSEPLPAGHDTTRNSCATVQPRGNDGRARHGGQWPLHPDLQGATLREQDGLKATGARRRTNKGHTHTGGRRTTRHGLLINTMPGGLQRTPTMLGNLLCTIAHPLRTKMCLLQAVLPVVGDPGVGFCLRTETLLHSALLQAVGLGHHRRGKGIFFQEALTGSLHRN